MDHVHSSHALSTAHMHSPNAYKILVSLYKVLHLGVTSDVRLQISVLANYLRLFVLTPGPIEVLIIRKDML